MRRALVTLQAGLTAAAGLTGFVAGLLLVPSSRAVAAPLLAALLALWSIEDLGRRLFIARSQFRALLINDVVYAAATLLILIRVVDSSRPLDLTMVLTAMTLGSAVAVCIAVAQLPQEWHPALPGSIALRSLLSFSGWQAAQLVTRPLVLLALRVLIAAFAGRAALGAVEAARLLIAPALTAISGFGSFLLARLAAKERSGTGGGPELVRRASGLLLVAGVLTSAAALVGVGVAGPLITGGTFDIDRVAVLGWGLYACALAVSLPLVTYFTVRRQARYVFVVRLAEYAAGLVAVVLFLLLDLPAWTPAALAAGGLVSYLVLRHRAGLLWASSAAPATVGTRPPRG